MTFCGEINEDGERESRKIINPLVLELDIYSLAHHLCKI
jgi:hypothetical protein